MEGQWYQNYRPTTRPLGGTFIPQVKLLEVKDKLSYLTEKLKEDPYSSDTWLARSWMLKSLGFAELALGDAHKARLLVERGVDRISSGRSEEQQQQLAVRMWAQITDALGEANALIDQRAAYKEGKKHVERYRASGWKENEKAGVFFDIFEEPAYLEAIEAKIGAATSKISQVADFNPEETDAMLSIGHVLVRNYPWMTPSQVTRSDNLRQQVASEIEQKTNGYATLSTSSITSQDGTPYPNMWGVRALKPIPAGHLLMSDPAPVSVSDRTLSLENGITLRCAQCQIPISPRKATKTDCKRCRFCSDTCMDIAKSSWHAIICPPTSTDLQKELPRGVPPRPGVRLELFARYLAALVHECGAVSSPDTEPSSSPSSSQDPASKHDSPQQHVSQQEDPLLHPLIARLTPNTTGPETHSLTYTETIILPFRILESLGINIFTTAHFDTWTLQAIRRRLDNNNTGKEIHGVWPRMAICNHSCEANVVYSPDEEGRAVLHLRAKRRIEVGEEVFVSYLGGGVAEAEDGDGDEDEDEDEHEDGDDEDLTSRRYRLLHWLGCECRCARCLREEEAAEDRRR